MDSTSPSTPKKILAEEAVAAEPSASLPFIIENSPPPTADDPRSQTDGNCPTITSTCQKSSPGSTPSWEGDTNSSTPVEASAATWEQIDSRVDFKAWLQKIPVTMDEFSSMTPRLRTVYRDIFTTLEYFLSDLVNDNVKVLYKSRSGQTFVKLAEDPSVLYECCGALLPDIVDIMDIGPKICLEHIKQLVNMIESVDIGCQVVDTEVLFYILDEVHGEGTGKEYLASLAGDGPSFAWADFIAWLQRFLMNMNINKFNSMDFGLRMRYRNIFTTLESFLSNLANDNAKARDVLYKGPSGQTFLDLAQAPKALYECAGEVMPDIVAITDIGPKACHEHIELLMKMIESVDIGCRVVNVGALHYLLPGYEDADKEDSPSLTPPIIQNSSQTNRNRPPINSTPGSPVVGVGCPPIIGIPPQSDCNRPPCNHGISNGDATKSDNAMNSTEADVKIVYDGLRDKTPPRQVIKKAQARIRKQHCRLITADGKSLILAYFHSVAAQFILNGDLESARNYCIHAVRFLFAVWQDKPRSYYEMLYITDQIKSDRGLITYVNKEIPCDCLSAKAKEIKANSIKTSFCGVCRKEVPFTSVLQCSRCQNLYVCSQECQQAAWGTHKKVCVCLTKNERVKYMAEVLEDSMAKTKAEVAKGGKTKRGKK